MGQIHRLARAHRRARRAPGRGLRLARSRPTPRTSPTAPTPSSASTTCATTWRTRARGDGPAGPPYAIVDEVDSILIDEARTPLIISGPASDSTKLYYQFAGIARMLERDVDYEVDEEKRTVVPTEEGIEKVEQALGVDNLYDLVAANLVHQLAGRAQGQGAVPPGQGLHRRRRRGEDRRRVHRPHPRGPALVRRPAPGGRGQGAGADQGGVPHLGDGHPPELLPPLRQARRHDRYRRDRGGGVRLDLRAAGRADPDQPADGPRRPGRPRSTRPSWPSSTRSSTTSSSATSAASRSSSAPRASRSPRCCRACSTSGASPTACSTPSSTPGRRRSSPRPAGSRAVTVATNMAGRGVDILLGGNPEGLARDGGGRPGSRPRQPGGRGPLPRAAARASRPSARPRATRSAPSAVCTCSDPSGTRAGASTTSSVAVPAARATRASRASTCRSRTS